MSKKLQFKTLIGPLVAFLMVLTLLLATATPAFADDADPPKLIPGLGKVTNAELHEMLLKTRAWYDSQYIVIRDSYTLAGYFQALIDRQKAKGRDVTGLETALSVFYGEITAAETARVNTVNILGKNAGFNGYFNVINRDLAGQTVLDARTNLKGTHLGLVLAVQELKRAYHSWREWMLKRP